MDSSIVREYIHFIHSYTSKVMRMQLVSRESSSTTKAHVRVAFYMRVSTAEQKLEGYSPEMQQAQLTEHVKRKEYKGWVTNPKWHLFDQGSGASADERKNLQNLMELVRKKEIDLVLVWKIDRLSRNLSDLLELFEEMDKYGVGFASVKEDLDFTGAIGKLIFQIFGALAEFERENIKMRTEEGKKASARAGNYVGGSIPYGYKEIPNPGGKGKKIQLVSDEAKIVRQIFEWYVHENKTSVWIALELNRLGIGKGEGNHGRTSGTKWYDGTIRNMLASEEYRGIYITNRWRIVAKKPRRVEERPKEEWITSPVPPIVDDVLFYMAQEKLKLAGQGKYKRGGGKQLYMLAGKLIDMGTKKGFVGYLSAKKTKNYRRKKIREDGKRSPNISIGAAQIEDFVWAYLEKAINDPEKFLALHRKQLQQGKQKAELSEKLALYEGTLSKANQRIERVNNDFYDGRINDEERQEWLAKYEAERDEAFKGKTTIEEAIVRLGTYDIACENLRTFAAKFKEDLQSFTYEQKQKVVDMLVERVEISETDTERRAKVYFRFDPVTIAGTIPVVEPTIRRGRPKSEDLFAVLNEGGGRQGIRTPDLRGVSSSL